MKNLDIGTFGATKADKQLMISLSNYDEKVQHLLLKRLSKFFELIKSIHQIKDKSTQIIFADLLKKSYLEKIDQLPQELKSLASCVICTRYRKFVKETSTE